ncbi:MAG: LPS assembly lipoprotein LptE [Gammaproteobacteria bacterium]|jgi:LPS-assembly lipoprotein
MKILKQTSILIITALLLTGCGFHLRGTQPWPPQLRVMYLQSNSPYSDFTKQLKNALRLSKVKLVNDPRQALIILYISQEHFYTNQTTVASTAQTRNYNATYTITYSLQNKYGNTIVKPKSVSATDTITVNQNEILENSNKLDITKQTLIRNLIMKLMFQLTSKHTILTLNKYSAIKHENHH